MLCAEVRLLLQRTLLAARATAPAAACRSALHKFGTHLRSLTCSVSHLLLQLMSHIDDSVHGSCATSPLVSELLLLAQFMQSSLHLPDVAAAYSAYSKFVVPAVISSLVLPDTIPAMTLPPRASAMLLDCCRSCLRR